MLKLAGYVGNKLAYFVFIANGSMEKKNKHGPSSPSSRDKASLLPLPRDLFYNFLLFGGGSFIIPVTSHFNVAAMNTTFASFNYGQYRP
jgi:hypothetical protein